VTGQLPPDWPPRVAPPGTPEWERSAVSWLYDQVPADYRAYEVLRRHPVLLARLAAEQVEASIEAARAGWRTVRADLRDVVPPEAVEAAIAVYEREGRRLTELSRAVAVVAGALAGRRWVPRL
jgi:hypothetical protein